MIFRYGVYFKETIMNLRIFTKINVTMNVEIKKNDEQMLVTMIGSLDTMAANQIDAQVKEIEAEANQPITIDCTQLDYISSTGLRLLLRIRKAAGAAGQKVTLHGVNSNVMEVLTVTGFDKMFVIEK